VPPDSPKRPHRRNNLALVLLRADRLADAIEVNAEAWTLKAGQHDVTSGRILVVRIALRLLLRLPDAGFYVGQLKTVLAMDPLGCLGDVSTTWDVPDVLRMISRRLRRDEAALVRHAVTALDGARAPGLDDLSAWRDAPPVTLETPWGGAEAQPPEPTS
jgi:hypothetical protein